MSFAIAVAVLALSIWFGTGLQAQVVQETGAIGDTQVMKWKDGKKAVFLLAYDDSCPSHITSAIPELEKRNLVGTFYIMAGTGVYKSRQADWEKAAKSPAVVLGNHTFTHVGATAPDQLDDELVKANDVIHALVPERKQPYLISFAQPGGVPWKVEKDVVDQLLAKHNLVSRPPFSGPPLSHKTLAEGMKIVDTAIEKGEMGHIDFHGVGGDWHVAPMDYYIPLLDRLQAESAQLWVTDHATYHKYATERKGAKVSVIAADGKAIRLALSADTDPSLYDQPLTLQTRIPADWTTCAVLQGQTRSQARIANGVAQYEAIPGPQVILLQPN